MFILQYIFNIIMDFLSSPEDYTPYNYDEIIYKEDEF